MVTRPDRPSEAPPVTPTPNGTAPVPAAAGGSVRLSSFRDHRPVLLYFSMGPG